MSRIVWDKTGELFYETGVDRAVLYPISSAGLYNKGVPWNGITGITESPSGAEPNNLYADNIKYLVLVGAEDFGLTVECYTYPDEWEECDGSAEIAPGVVAGQQNRKVFGLSYRTKLGNDVDGQDHGYKLHLVYGGLASPSERGYQTVNDSPEPINPSWEITTTPVDVPGYKPTARLIITSTKVDPAKLKALEDILYGTEDQDARLPLPEEVIQLLKPSVAVTASPESADATLFGKKVSDLQTNVAVGADSITGTLKNVTGYTEFSSKPAEQSGHYLALKFDVTPTDAVTTVELVGGTKGPRDPGRRQEYRPADQEQHPERQGDLHQGRFLRHQDLRADQPDPGILTTPT